MTKPSEALLLGLYNVIGTLARQGYEKGIFCCLAGSHYEKKSKSTKVITFQIVDLVLRGF